MPRKLVFSSVVAAALTVSVAAYAAMTAGPVMGPVSRITRPAFHGYYDGHRDTYLNTDVSSKTEAAAMHINYSAPIGTVKGLPEIYLVEGRAARSPLAIFGSEPGQGAYTA